MRIEKEYLHLEDVNEIRIFDATGSDFYSPSPQEFDIDDNPIKEFIDNISEDVHTFIPYENGKDFIVQSLSGTILDVFNTSPENIKGRLLSKISPLYFDILGEYLRDVYKNRNTKDLRLFYYSQDKFVRRTNAKVVFDMERIFLIAKDIKRTRSKDGDAVDGTFDEVKTNIFENLSQTGSYYKINGKYSWSHGIYNIINRPKEESDDYYNIILDLVVPEDKPIVDRIIEITNREVSQCEEIIRIIDGEGVLKDIEFNIYSHFDEDGAIVRQGLVKDITHHHHYELSKPVDFLLDGFKSSTKLSLLIEPLSKKQYNFSKGFYYFIEKDYEDYAHSREILKNIVEKDIVEKLIKITTGQINRFDETITYMVDGDPNNIKVADVYIERFRYKDNVHSLGFLTDITEEMQKQEQLTESNKQQMVLIKELHHRVKNNLQILNSFLNLEKRAYGDHPDLVIEHMQARLSSLALLHEKTYDSPDFNNINLKEYLVDHDVKTKRLVDSPMDFELETHVDEDLNLSIEVITPLLLIIDELMMVAIKDAFNNQSSNKRITKTVEKLDKDAAVLTIDEVGIGINDSNDIKDKIGCEIVKNLTKQLDGTITSTRNENGITYKLVFPIEMEHTIH